MHSCSNVNYMGVDLMEVNQQYIIASLYIHIYNILVHIILKVYITYLLLRMRINTGYFSFVTY